MCVKTSFELDPGQKRRIFWGNLGQAVSLTSTLTFALCVYLYINDLDASEDNPLVNNTLTNNVDLFDSEWKQEGFCVTNAQKPIINSHAVCLYVDIILGLALAALYFPNRNRVELQYSNPVFAPAVFGIIGHGIAHGLTAYSMHQKLQNGLDPTSSTQENTQQENQDFFHRFVLSLLFWAPLLKAAMPNSSWMWVLVSAQVSNWMSSTLADNLQFTFVQTILMVAFSINQLLRPAVEKSDLHYCLYAWMVSVPITLVGWMESTQCNTFVKDMLYGHVAYDAYIPLSGIACYALCLRDANERALHNATKKAQ